MKKKPLSTEVKEARTKSWTGWLMLQAKKTNTPLSREFLRTPYGLTGKEKKQ